MGGLSPGIGSVLDFLASAARPRADFACWIDHDVSEGEPVVLLLGRKTGLLSVLVRDWRPEELVAATPTAFVLKRGGERVRRPNPDRVGRARASAIAARLKEAGDDPRVPVGHMTAFPEVSRAAFLERGFQWFVPEERALFLEDLDPEDGPASDPSGARFRQRIRGAHPFRFRGASRGELNRIWRRLHPEARIRDPRDIGELDRFRQGVRLLDEAQAGSALRLGAGDQVITGPPGSGKTLVLVHRCAFLARYGSGFRRILLVCYNIALVGYLEGLLRERGLSPDEDALRVTHFYALCGRVLDETISDENREDTYYRDVVRRTLERLRQGGEDVPPRFDAVLVDEAQDFSDDMLRVVLEMRKGEGDLVIAMDATQDLYGRKASWTSLGVRARGRTRRLKQVYRNTAEVFEFGRRFMGQAPGGGRQPALLPDPWPFHGPTPRLVRQESREDVLAFLVKEIRALVEEEGCGPGGIAVIYDDKVYDKDRLSYDNRAVPMRVQAALEAGGVPVRWVSRDARAKRSFGTETDRVALISIHSAKGLDFDRVFLVGVDRLKPSKGTERKMLATLYVAITRARYALTIPYVEETPLIRRMQEALKR